MKIVMIHGQNHKGSTYHMGRLLADDLAPEGEIREFFLPRDLDHHCLGCMACVEAEEKCPFSEEKKIIAEAMDQAEVLIFTTPNYCMAPSGPMKAFMDLFFQNWIPHRPKGSMFRKKAVVLSTTAGNGAGKAVKPIKRMLAYWGVPWVKTYGVAVQASGWGDVTEEKKEKLQKDMARLARKVKSARVGKPSPFIRFMFRMMANIRKKDPDYMATESVHWKQNGWLDGARPWK